LTFLGEKIIFITIVVYAIFYGGINYEENVVCRFGAGHVVEPRISCNG
jgi:hypothetical protein